MVIIDYQRGICDPRGALGRGSGLPGQVRQREITGRLSHVFRTARSVEFPVVHVRTVFDPGYLDRTCTAPLFDRIEELSALVAGSQDVEFIEEAQPTDQELVLSKRGISALAGTGLAETLVRSRVDHLYVAGVSTNFAIESTVRQAVDEGFGVTVLEDLCAAASLEAHQYSVENILSSLCEIASSDAFAGELIPKR